MAPSRPSDADVRTLQEFLEVSKAHATIMLEKYSNVEQAMNQYFEDPVAAVKPRPPANQWEHADSLPYADDTTELPTMSRPPSRVDNRIEGPQNSTQIDVGMLQPDEMLDPDLQRAIAMSKQDLSGQESGIVELGQQFGPANRPYYDSNQWALTTIASSREVVEHPPPAKRQRLSEQPAFLRGSPETGYLAPLLNIYHNIPLAREAFLLPSMRVLSYGHDPQWWSGTSDENTKAISVETSERSSQDSQNFLGELQCLMAFLDRTNRAYGSVDALADLRTMRMCNSESQLSRLLESWVAAAMLQAPDDQLTQIFTSTAIKAPDNEGFAPINKGLVCLEPQVHRLEGQTLVNMLDMTIWDDLTGNIDDIWIQQCADVFTMRLYDPKNENKGLGLEVPAIWYPDRYMYEHRETTRQWRKEMLAIRQEINQCSIIQRRCEVAQGPNKRVIKIRDVLEAASKLSSDLSPNIEGTPVPGASVSDDDGLDTIQEEQLGSQLQSILQRIDEKVKILEARKQDLQAKVKNIASQLTSPSSESAFSPRHKYYLQGVSTKPNVTYVRRRNREPQTLIDTTTDADTPEFQWWRMVWGRDPRTIHSTTQSTTDRTTQAQQDVRNLMSTDVGNRDNANVNEDIYAVCQIEENEVLEAAKTEHNSVVLVYANESALNFLPSNLSVALREFVQQDNRAFQEESNQGNIGQNRRYSQDTNTTIMDDVLLDDRSTPPGQMRELTPMSMTSPQREADGQPSPKRAKGDDAYQVYREPDSEEEPPPYEEVSIKPQMQEKKVNRIGLLADQMLEKYSKESVSEPDNDGPVHIEHAKEPLR